MTNAQDIIAAYLAAFNRGDWPGMLAWLGQYLAADPGLPPAHGQRYSLPAGAFYTLRDGKISRVCVFYNLRDWIAQVAA